MCLVENTRGFGGDFETHVEQVVAVPVMCEKR